MPHFGWFEREPEERQSDSNFDSGNYFIVCLAVFVVLCLLSLIFWK